ncbi:MAG: AI-2E family transporter YdiK [Betaproteobacteria bacterium]|nr:AI-2E family transporter YdiK [Betaproteobacteria bacterium]
MQEKPPADLVRTTLGVLFLGGLILSSFWILRPFIGAVIWATMLVVATWPVMKWFEARLWRRRSLAVLVMSLLLLLLFFVPLTLAIGTIVSHSDEIVERGKSIASSPLPHPPQWVAQLPFVGEKITRSWEDAIAAGASGLLAKLMPYADNIAKWLVSQAGSIGFLLLQFLLTVIISALMYAGGESAALAVHRFGRRLAGHSGENAVTLAGQAIRGVALGVGVTAVVQAGLGGVGLAIAGIPFAGLLTAVMLMLCIAQVGPALVMFPAVAWVYWTGENGWGTFLLLWALVVSTMDNFLRPALIKRGADLPLLLIFAGVIGGLIGFGLVGIFVGPVLLAVAYTLLDSWVGDGNAPRPTTEGS